MNLNDTNEEFVSRTLTVTKIINYFREALIGMIPPLEKAKINWQNDEQDEDFEGIVEGLYHWIVVYKLESMVAGKFDIQPETARYGILYSDYSKKSFIEAGKSLESEEPGFFVFSYLKTGSEPFDTVVCNKMNSYGKVIEKNLEFNISELQFRYQHRDQIGKLTSFTNIL